MPLFVGMFYNLLFKNTVIDFVHFVQQNDGKLNYVFFMNII